VGNRVYIARYAEKLSDTRPGRIS